MTEDQGRTDSLNKEERGTSDRGKSVRKSGQRLQYSQESLEKALDSVRSGRTSLNSASVQFGIPETTLHSKISEAVPDSCTVGRQSVLTASEEERLEKWIIGKAELGFPMHPEEVKDAVQKVLQEQPRQNPFKDNRPGNKWMTLFLKRHPLIAKRHTESISKARASVTEKTLREWFTKTEEYLCSIDALDVLQDPRRIFNADETGIQVSPKSNLLLGPKNQKNFYEISAGSEKENMTVLFAFNAAGEAMLPMIIYPYKRLPAHVVESVPDDMIAGGSDSGWVVSGSFYEYLANHFHRWLIAEEIPLPVIFFIDGARPHLDEAAINFCRANKIILYCLPPQATHIMQPCDVSVFKVLKGNWRRAVHNHKQKTHKSITKTNFAGILKVACDELLQNKQVIVNGFKSCGLYPFNADASDYTKCISKRRKDLFGNPHGENSAELSIEDYVSATKVIENIIGQENVDTFTQMRHSHETRQNSLYLLWKICQDGATGSTSPDMLQSISDIISFELDSVVLPLEESIIFSGVMNHADGIFSIPFDESTNIADLEDSIVIENCNNDVNGNCYSHTKDNPENTEFETSVEEENSNGRAPDDTDAQETVPGINIPNHSSSTTSKMSNQDPNDDRETFSLILENEGNSRVTDTLDHNGNKCSGSFTELIDNSFSQNCSISDKIDWSTDQLPTKSPANNVNLNTQNVQPNSHSPQFSSSNLANVQSPRFASVVKKSTDVWTKHLHWPQTECDSTKKVIKKPIPHALTGKEWQAEIARKKEAQAAKERHAVERVEMRRIKREAREAEMAERLKKRELKRQEAATAKVNAEKLREEKARLKERSKRIKEEQLVEKCKTKKIIASSKIPVRSVIKTKNSKTEETDRHGKNISKSKKREVEVKKRSNEPLPKTPRGEE